MKKPYVKPQVHFENFQLSASIAAGCKLISTNLAQYDCPYTDPDLGVIFAKEPCQYGPPDGDNSVCYHPPAGNNVIFTS